MQHKRVLVAVLDSVFVLTDRKWRVDEKLDLILSQRKLGCGLSRIGNHVKPVIELDVVFFAPLLQPFGPGEDADSLSL